MSPSPSQIKVWELRSDRKTEYPTGYLTSLYLCYFEDSDPGTLRTINVGNQNFETSKMKVRELYDGGLTAHSFHQIRWTLS